MRRPERGAASTKPWPSGKNRPYYVYVIESCVNGKKTLYVGQSAKTPEARFREQSASCKTYCSTCRCRHYVPGKVLRLRRELFEQYNPLPSRQEAERIEKWLFRHLRRRGHRVKGGH